MTRIPAIALLLVACARGPAPAPAPPLSPAPVPKAQPDLGSSLDWVRRSTEHRAIALQTYAMAGKQLEEMSRGLLENSWAVVLDADETVLDNSRYQQEQADAGLPFSDSAWFAFLRREASAAMPGAVAFLRKVHELGGRSVIVTNRASFNCDYTRNQLRKLSLDVDLVLCRPVDGSSDKNPRFRAIEQGTAGLPAMRVLMYVGDNVLDFPALSQQLRLQPDSAFARFGRAFILLPNPLYGSWQFIPR